MRKKPSNLVVASMSGKTTCILDMILKKDVIFDVNIKKVFYVFKTYQERFRDFTVDGTDITFMSDYCDVPSDANEPIMVVYDDMMLDFQSQDNKNITDLFTRGVHHNGKGMVVIYTYTQQSKRRHYKPPVGNRIPSVPSWRY
jgi:hypothetical protein